MKSDEAMQENRRSFLSRLWRLSLASLFLGSAHGCASGSLAFVKSREQDGTIRISKADLPPTNSAQNTIAVKAPDLPGGYLVVFNNPQRGFRALSPVCTHLGCIARKVREGFECPCHGSRYDLDGQVTKGPAARPLTSFRVREEGEELVVEVD